ncbi:SfnB family sulfur acquisition oxidoreductase [Acinetobacter rudis]|uniref:Dibenzothiophene monooxygenase n=1 Tax=Acinetobacter rudis TaxID=632955 RepID=A0AAW8JBB9_9GAMM|nr:SfnB family sulfur acquisition oxidoreductase [Acinetobacter rudis]MDQ8936242.1 SfnB family sulfur acquisition oxidoreductase [Acinetobacter rudis]MDQ9018505.1 SfnB family sulfur acquisition oxidoreductase [Acinetobacter rudis]
MSNLNVDSYIQQIPKQAAHRIETEQEAIEIAKQLAAKFLLGAAERDQQRLLPVDELNAYSQSGLWAIRVPKAFGGIDASYRTVVEVFKIIAEADGSLGQIPQNHISIVDTLLFDASDSQKKFFYDLVLKGIRFGNAFSEIGNKHVADFQTKIKKQGNDYIVNGKKFFSTGALLAHWIPIVAVDDEANAYLAITPRDTAGLTIRNDWSSFGQKTTASGSVEIENVRVPAEYVVAIHSFENPTPTGAISQILQAAIDAGLARSAIEETIHYVKQHTRPWIDAKQDKATEDHFTIATIGDLKTRLQAAEAVLDLAADQIDIAISEVSEENSAQASILVAQAKILTTEIAILATNKLFELAGTRSTLAAHNLDRHWRNARTHTLHDPVRWKYYVVGNYYLNDIQPERHAWL